MSREAGIQDQLSDFSLGFEGIYTDLYAKGEKITGRSGRPNTERKAMKEQVLEETTGGTNEEADLFILGKNKMVLREVSRWTGKMKEFTPVDSVLMI